MRFGPRVSRSRALTPAILKQCVDAPDAEPGSRVGALGTASDLSPNPAEIASNWVIGFTEAAAHRRTTPPGWRTPQALSRTKPGCNH